MKYLITLTGPSGCGKSTIEKILTNKYGLRRAVSHTTRQARMNEIPGKDYYFVTPEILQMMYNEGKLAEFTSYNNNLYGVSIEELKNSDVLVVEPHGLNQIKKTFENSPDLKIISIYINISPDEQILRMRKRKDNEDEIMRRVENDKEWFKPDINMYDIIIDSKSSPDFNNNLSYILFILCNLLCK